MKVIYNERENFWDIEGNSVNLCDSCALAYPETCTAGAYDVFFGDNDNTCCCSHYIPIKRKDNV